MGDPLGIGPEVVVKALSDPALRASARFVIYGDNEVMLRAAEQAGVHPFWFRTSVEHARDGAGALGDFTVIDYAIAGTLGSDREPSKSGGLASKNFVEDAIQDALLPQADERRLDAIVTAPISKESWAMAGFRWPGHTELLGARTKSRRQAMAFVSPRLKVVLATTHVPLMDIRNLLTIGRVHEPIVLGHELCLQLGIAHPRIAVCGLNPHAGENGLFGDEESRVIRPAIDMAKAHGIDVHGPFPGDTVFIDAAAGSWDLVVAMYHDQGLIPVKLLGWDKAVNVTLGLPIVRTSPDHGTAFGIAGRNQASEGSMKSAIELAVRLVAQPASA
ncbi:MAG: 4-hydroxythreonine-4-phosphate dehydrogenase [Planctomycetota bacterium]|jgi:4-hydroxythreonine-4-phosphate dehydrogenase